jgi:SRSO17 transposase
MPPSGTKYFVLNYDETKSPREMVLVAHQRYKVEQGYQQLKEELGLEHFDGRSWSGLHLHIALCFMACDFLQTLVRSKSRGKKSPANIAED